MRSSAGKQSWNTWAHISGQVVLFHPQSFWLTKGLKKPKRKYVLCSGSTFSPGFLIKDDFIVWLPIKVFVFLSSLSLGSVTMIHHFSTLVPHSYSHFSNLIFFLWSYYFHFSAHKLNQSIFALPTHHIRELSCLGWNLTCVHRAFCYFMHLWQGLQATVRNLAYVNFPFSQDSAPDKHHAEITQKPKRRKEIQQNINGNTRKRKKGFKKLNPP